MPSCIKLIRLEWPRSASLLYVLAFVILLGGLENIKRCARILWEEKSWIKPPVGNSISLQKCLILCNFSCKRSSDSLRSINMVESPSLACTIWLLIFHLTTVLSAAVYIGASHLLNASQSIEDICPTSAAADWCYRCVQLYNIQDAKQCYFRELTQQMPDEFSTIREEGLLELPDGLVIPVKRGKWGYTTADVYFLGNGKNIALSVNIDSCRRVNWDTYVGPMNVDNKRLDDVTMEDIVNQLFALTNEDAANLVLVNAREGKREVEAFLNKANSQQLSYGPTLSEEIEAIGNKTIQYISNVVCKAAGGTALSSGTWLSMQATLAHYDRDVPLDLS